MLSYYRVLVPIGCFLFLTTKRANYYYTRGDDAGGDAIWDRANAYASVQIVEAALRLRGFYLKIFQAIGSKSDWLPTAYQEAFSVLHDDMPFRPLSRIREGIEAGLGPNVSMKNIFASFDPEPMNSATIAQVRVLISRLWG